MDLFLHKVEKILKGSLDSIPSPSVKIQIMGRKVCLRYKDKTLIIAVNKLMKTKSLLTSPSNVLPYYLKQTFPPKIEFSLKVNPGKDSYSALLDPGYLLKPFLHTLPTKYSGVNDCLVYF